MGGGLGDRLEVARGRRREGVASPHKTKGTQAHPSPPKAGWGWVGLGGAGWGWVGKPKNKKCSSEKVRLEKEG